MKHTLFICIAILYAWLPVQVSKAADAILYDCKTTPSLTPLVPLPEGLTNQTNNLRRKTALIQTAKGTVMYVEGRVVDENCVPVSDALVTIWHADYNGYYKLPQIEGVIEEEMEEIIEEGEHLIDKSDPYFLGMGKAVTNNLGHYSFISIVPGALEGEVPVIHMRVQHDRFDTFETDIFLDDKWPIDITDLPYIDFSMETLMQLTAFSEPIDRLKPNAGRRYVFPITLSGKAYKRHF